MIWKLGNTSTAYSITSSTDVTYTFTIGLLNWPKITYKMFEMYPRHLRTFKTLHKLITALLIKSNTYVLLFYH